jgi:hypothetical protein
MKLGVKQSATFQLSYWEAKKLIGLSFIAYLLGRKNALLGNRTDLQSL